MWTFFSFDGDGDSEVGGDFVKGTVDREDLCLILWPLAIWNQSLATGLVAWCSCSSRMEANVEELHLDLRTLLSSKGMVRPSSEAKVSASSWDTALTRGEESSSSPGGIGVFGIDAGNLSPESKSRSKTRTSVWPFSSAISKMGDICPGQRVVSDGET